MESDKLPSEGNQWIVLNLNFQCSPSGRVSIVGHGFPWNEFRYFRYLHHVM